MYETETTGPHLEFPKLHILDHYVGFKRCHKKIFWPKKIIIWKQRNWIFRLIYTLCLCFSSEKAVVYLSLWNKQLKYLFLKQNNGL